VRNESLRLPYFLSYYRKKGIRKFLIVDNNSTDDTLSYLLNEPDVYVWQSKHSFNKANFGSVWFELLLRKFGKRHWCLTLDADELLVYPGYEKKDISQLCRELDKNNKKALSAVLLDMYSDKPIKDTLYQTGQDFLEVCSYFDKKFYHTKYEKCGPYKNQIYYFGGVRERLFGDKGSYLLSKIPMLKYDSNFVLAGGQHWTNRPESEIAEESGCLLHFKFFSTFIDYVKQEAERKEHYGNGFQYNEYVQNISNNTDLILFDKSESVKFLNDKQLVDLGIMKAHSSNGHSFSFPNSPIKFPQIKPVPPNTARPLWSVMITVYKRTEYLERALSSVLQQAPNPDEMQIEVIQDGTDKTVRKKIESIIQKIGGSRVCFYPVQKQFGHPHIFNLCIERAHGHWIHILHDDDWIKPGFYSTLQKGIKKEPNIGAAFCRHVELKGQGRQWFSWTERETPGVIPNWLERIATMCRIQFSSLVVKREVYEGLGGFYSGANSAFDWDMWKRIAIHYPFWFEPEILACTTREGFAETDHLIRSGQQIADTRKSIELSHSYFPKDIADELTNKARENYALYALDVAKLQIENHDHQAAIANIREALKCIQPRND
jgi:glycosyltransferase involved in cell wall biosynthesis